MRFPTNATPRALFVIDGAGALLSAVLLGAVMPMFQPWVGIPTATLYLLASIPCGFALFDAACVVFQPGHSARFLQAIALANLSYCVLSLALAVYHSSTLTYLGWVYIVGEIAIILVLVKVEWRVAAR